MRRIASGVIAALFVAAVVAGCSSGNTTTAGSGGGATQAPATSPKTEPRSSRDESPDTTERRTATTQRSTGTTRGGSTPTTGSGSSANNEDAAKGLVTESQLPPGNWKSQTTNTGTKTSGDEFKKYPSCSSLIDDPGVLDIDAKKAKASFNQESATDLLQIEQQVLIFDSDGPPKDFVKLLGSGEKLAPCMQDLLSNQPSSNGTSLGGTVTASAYDPGVTAADLGVDELSGTTVKLTLTAGGQSLPTEITFINMRKGNAVSAFSVTTAGLGGTPPAMPSMSDTLAAAAKKLQPLG